VFAIFNQIMRCFMDQTVILKILRMSCRMQVFYQKIMTVVE